VAGNFKTPKDMPKCERVRRFPTQILTLTLTSTLTLTKPSQMWDAVSGWMRLIIMIMVRSEQLNERIHAMEVSFK
jgi:hypothetical protein